MLVSPHTTMQDLFAAAQQRQQLSSAPRPIQSGTLTRAASERRVATSGDAALSAAMQQYAPPLREGLLNHAKSMPEPYLLVRDAVATCGMRARNATSYTSDTSDTPFSCVVSMSHAPGCRVWFSPPL